MTQALTGTNMAIAAVLALIMTPLVSLIKKEHWPEELKFLIAVIISGAVASAQVITNNKVQNLQDLLSLWGTALATTQATYVFYFQNSKLDVLLTKIGVKSKDITLAPPVATAPKV